MDSHDGEREPVRERLSPSDLDNAFDSLLADSALTQVVAIDKTGFFAPMPPSVPLTTQRPVVMTSYRTTAIEFVIGPDQRAVIEAWVTARETGSGSCSVHPLCDPETEATIVFLDLTNRFGVFLGFFVGEFQIGEHSDAPIGLMQPRVSTIRKDEYATIIDCDEAITAILGRPRSELIGKRTVDLIHPDDQVRAVANWLDMINAPGLVRRVQLRHQHMDGHWVWFEVTNTNLMTDPDHGYVSCEMIDISEEMAAAEALRARELLLRRLTEALPEGVLQLDTDGSAVYANTRLAEMLGREVGSGADLVAALNDFEQPPRTLSAALTAVLTEGIDSNLEATFTTSPHADPRRLQLTLRALVQEDKTVSGAVICVNDVTEAVQLRELLAFKLAHDPLTGCLSRGAVMERLSAHLAQPGPGLALLFVDLDQFKRINDEFGHAVGDNLLRHVAQTLMQNARDDDVVGRIGGDEFLVMMPGIGSQEEAGVAAERMDLAAATPFLLAGEPHTPKVSIGMAWTDRPTDTETLIAQADASMYLVKSGRSAEKRPSPPAYLGDDQRGREASRGDHG
jgi:diguanylate cyclase (GGDEF)-like protein/PAS domain S-box-containing protein